MNRKLLLLLLAPLLATGAVLADEVPESEGATDTDPAAEHTEQSGDSAAEAEETAGAGEAQAQAKDGAKVISGMSILGNQEAPKSLVIVPWKSSEIGDSIGISTMLDDSRQPVDRDVFMRALNYYEIRKQMTP
jgi:hypothetical protein